MSRQGIGHDACCVAANVNPALSFAPFACSRGWRFGFALIALACACATSAQHGGDSSSAENAAARDTARIARLEREARTLASTTGCETAAACRTAPLGVRGCGGPRDYLVYCPAATDTAALLRKLDELSRVEAAYNEREGVISTCQMRLPPALSVSGGRCVATR